MFMLWFHAISSNQKGAESSPISQLSIAIFMSIENIISLFIPKWTIINGYFQAHFKTSISIRFVSTFALGKESTLPSCIDHPTQ